ncbi:DUF732 domain-containing protein [Streptomyces roseifaciens]
MQKRARTWLTVGAAVIVVGGVLSLFEDGDKDSAEAKPQSSASVPARGAEKPATSPKPNSGVPSPDVAQREALIRALRTVDPRLVAKEDRAVDRARNVCADIEGGKDSATVQKNAKARFEGGTVPSLTDDQAASVVTAVRSSFCS